jgi:putative thiamine transport system ATP-binding protein
MANRNIGTARKDTIAMLEISHLHYGYNTPLVQDLSFVVPPGEIRLLHGSSGCGKSTLLSLILGTQDASLTWSGQITLNGTCVTLMAPHQRQVGLMFQDALLFPHLSVADNLTFGLTRSVTGAARRRAVLDALGAAGLAGFEERDPASLSGGQAARVALMRALLADPKALLLDEAFTSLDPALRQQFGRFVADQISQRQIPALLVSHDVADRQFAHGEALDLDQYHVRPSNVRH